MSTRFSNSIGMANHSNRNISVADDTDVFAQLSQLLESNYLHDVSSPSSSSRKRISDAANPRSKSNLNDNSNISSANGTGNVTNHLYGDEMDMEGTFRASSNQVGSSRNGVISFQTWQSKLHGNKNVSVDKNRRTESKAASSNRMASNTSDCFPQSIRSESERWSVFLERVNQKEKEKQRSIKSEQWRLDAAENEECFFSPNLTTKSLKMAADFEQLRDRIPRLLTAREDFLEQQRLLFAKRETAECTFTPTRIGADRSDRYLQNPSNSLLSPENYKPYLDERRRKEEVLRSQIAEKDAVEFTFQPKTNSSKVLAARSCRLLKAKREREKHKDKEMQCSIAGAAGVGVKDEIIIIASNNASRPCEGTGHSSSNDCDDLRIGYQKGAVDGDERERVEEDDDERERVEEDERERVEEDEREKVKDDEKERIEGDQRGRVEVDEDEIENVEEEDDVTGSVEGDENDMVDEDEREWDVKNKITAQQISNKNDEIVTLISIKPQPQLSTASVSVSCNNAGLNEQTAQRVKSGAEEDLEELEHNCHERLYRRGLNHLARVSQIHERTHGKDPAQGTQALSWPHPTCERLYREGLQRLEATMPTTEQNIKASYKALSSWPAPFSPSAVDPQHPFRARPRSRSRGTGGHCPSSSSRSGNPPSQPPYDSYNSSSSSAQVVVMRGGGRKEKESDERDKETTSKHRHLGSYVTVVDCSSEEAADRSSDYLRDLWTDLKSS